MARGIWNARTAMNEAFVIAPNETQEFSLF